MSILHLPERRHRRGANAIEFALIGPIIATIVMGCLDYGMFFQQSLVVIQAAHVGARAGSVAMDAVEADNDGVVNWNSAAVISTTETVCNLVLADLNRDGDCVATAPDAIDVLLGRTVTVVAQVPYKSFTGFLQIPEYTSFKATYRISDFD